MAYVNVLEWKAEQVADWLQGLDDTIFPYSHYFINNNVTGRGLLNITVDDLYKLHVEKLGHQEIILEGLEHLRNLHHHLDSENLQYVCLKLSCKARSLFNELTLFGPGNNEAKEKISTGSMSAAADVLDALWTLVSWLDRSPFTGHHHFDGFKVNFLKIGVELATSSQRDTFAEKPVSIIKDCCEELANMADTLIRDVNDPIILQPASLDIATVKRKTDDENFGIVFETSAPPGVHIITEVKFQSPAHQCGRVLAGDEVVQVNYQTVVGWHVKKVIQLMNENPSEMILTLKKRPRHLPVFGQIYIKPFRIPARKNERNHYFNNLPSPRAELLVAPKITFPVHRPKVSSATCATTVTKPLQTSESDEDVEVEDDVEVDDDDVQNGSKSNVSGSPDLPKKSPTHSMRSVLSRPRSAPQRRATISGSSPSHYKPYINISEIWGMDVGSRGSTIRSNDSGHETLEGSVSRDTEEILRRAEQRHEPRPQTIGASNFSNHYFDFSDPDYVIFCHKPDQGLPPPPHPPVPSQTSLVCDNEYVNLEEQFGDISLKRQLPIPKPRQIVTKEESQSSPNRKKPIPQPRKISSASSLDPRSFRSSLAEAKDVCPVPTAQFKSFKRVTEPSPSPFPDYVNTTPPPPPSNPPPPLEPRDLSIGGVHLGATSIPKPPSNVVMRSKNSLEIVETSPNRRGVVLLENSTTESPQVRSTPYYMGDVYREGTPEKNWIESLRKGPHQELVKDRTSPLGDGKVRRGQLQQQHCDSSEDGNSSPPPPPVPERHYDVPYAHLNQLQLPKNYKN